MGSNAKDVDLSQFGYESDEEAGEVLSRAIEEGGLTVSKRGRRKETFAFLRKRGGDYLSATIPWWAIERAVLSAPVGLQVYLTLIKIAVMNRSMECWNPSLWVFDQLGISPKRMAEALRGLEEAGLLTILRRDTGRTRVRLADPPDEPPETASVPFEYEDEQVGCGRSGDRPQGTAT